MKQEKKIKVNTVEKITHDVLHIVTERPPGIDFTPGQAAELSIDKEGWRNEKRPFTFTSLPQHNFLEFMIKTYPSQNGVTRELLNLKKGDSLILHEVFGAIEYKGEGVFIAGGAGITPFISIFRDLESKNGIGNNALIFANKTKSDIIIEDELRNLLSDRFINILSHEKIDGYEFGFISEHFLRKYINDFSQYFYLCGPTPMMEAVQRLLSHMGVQGKSIVQESF